MKAKEWATPNRMRFESAHKTFNRKVDLIGTGNVWGSVQTSGYIRPYSATECNGFTFEPGHLREYDLKGFVNMPANVRSYVRAQTANRPVILYKFFHVCNRGYWKGESKTVHGWVVTSTDPEYRLLRYFVTGPTWKSEGVLLEAIKYITKGGDND